QCLGCGEVKPLAMYHRSSAEPDGHRSRCKTCRQTESRTWYLNNRERIIAYQASRLRTNPGHEHAMMRRARQRRLEEYRAADRARYWQTRDQRLAYYKLAHVREIMRANAQRQRARRRGMITERISSEDWRRLQQSYVQ